MNTLEPSALFEAPARSAQRLPQSLLELKRGKTCSEALSVHYFRAKFFVLVLADPVVLGSQILQEEG